MKLHIYSYIMASEPISTEYFITPIHRPVCLHVYSHTVAMQRLDKNVTAAINAHATIENFLNASFFMQSV
jgi:hypothetical protein